MTSLYQSKFACVAPVEVNNLQKLESQKCFQKLFFQEVAATCALGKAGDTEERF